MKCMRSGLPSGVHLPQSSGSIPSPRSLLSAHTPVYLHPRWWWSITQNREGGLFLTFTVRRGLQGNTGKQILQEQLEEKSTSILRRHKEKIKYDPGLQMCLHRNYMPHKEKYVENARSSACFQRLEWNNTMPDTVWTEWGEWFLFRANRVTTSLTLRFKCFPLTATQGKTSQAFFELYQNMNNVQIL